MKVVYAIVNERDIDHSVANKHDGLSLMANGVQKQKNATAQCMTSLVLVYDIPRFFQCWQHLSVRRRHFCVLVEACAEALHH